MAIVKRLETIAGFKLAALAAMAGFVFVSWFLAPVLETISFQAWRAVGLIGAAALGGVGVLTIGGWLRVALAEASGIVAGAAWAEFRISDVTMGVIQSLVAAVLNEGPELLGPWIMAGFAGAFLAWLGLRRKMRRQQRQKQRLTAT